MEKKNCGSMPIKSTLPCYPASNLTLHEKKKKKELFFIKSCGKHLKLFTPDFSLSFWCKYRSQQKDAGEELEIEKDQSFLI